MHSPKNQKPSVVVLGQDRQDLAGDGGAAMGWQAVGVGSDVRAGLMWPREAGAESYLAKTCDVQLPNPTIRSERQRWA